MRHSVTQAPYTAPDLKPLPPHAYEALALELEVLIRGGHFVAGDRLPSERRLAERYGVSRPTVRAALAQLESRGLVYSRSGAGTYVAEQPELTNDEPEPDLRPGDVLETRLALEVSVARLAARRAAANPAELNRLRVAVAALERVADPAEVPTELDAAFHRGVAALTGNRYLMRALEPIWESLAGRALAATWSPEATGRTATEHRAIYEALVVGDGELAAFAMERHLRSLAATILDDSVFDGPSPRYYA